MGEIILQRKVYELIEDDGERERLFKALRLYQTDQDLSRLLSEMRDILDHPRKLELYSCMRPLILLHHQLTYSQCVTFGPGVKARVIRLRRRAGESLGFAVRGGLEHGPGVGMVVVDVTPDYQAARQGLVIGDQILSVNGFSIAEAIHADVLSLIKAREEIVLRVTNVAMLPVKEDARSEVKWKYVDLWLEGDANTNGGSTTTSQRQKDLKIFIDTSNHNSLGCGIVSGPPHSPGIYVERVHPGGLAEEVGLEPGDLVLEVNGTKFHQISHSEAVQRLVSSRQLHMVIRKGEGLDWRSANMIQKSNKSTDSFSSNQKSESCDGFTISTTLATSSTSTTTAATAATAADVFVEKPFLPSEERIETLTEIAAGRTSHVSPGDFHNRVNPLVESSMIDQEGRQQTSPSPTLPSPGDIPRWQFDDSLSNKFYDMFSSSELDGRQLLSLTYPRSVDLGVCLEGGLNSPLGGKIMISVLHEHGLAFKSGHMRVGDQVMAVDGKRLIGLTIMEAEKLLEGSSSTQDNIQLVFCASTLINEEESLTYF